MPPRRKNNRGGESLPTLLIKKWTAENKEVYYGKIRVNSETYSCGDCVTMDTDKGEFLAEILYIFRDRSSQAWVEIRWLYNKEEIQENMPKTGCLDIDDAEVFETDDVSASPAGAILHKVAVLDEVDYRARTQEDTVDDGRDFFCNNFFDTRLRRFMAAGDQGPALRLRRGRRYSERSEGPDAVGGSSGDDSSSEDDAINSIDEGGRGGTRDQEDQCRQHPPPKRRRSSGQPKVQDKFSLAMDSLHVTAVPKSLPCRTTERDTLLQFLKSNVMSGGLGSALFVAGMPGTGKTATAHEVVCILREQQARGLLPPFKLVELNGMRLIKPHQAYTQFWMMLAGEMLSPKRALSKLDRYFSDNDPSREFVVLLVDELDYMTTKKQMVLYNLFDWPSRPQSRLVVVGIANTVDLPERCMPRVSSRLTSRLTFPAYQKPQLVQIVQGRLAEANMGGGNAFKPGAIHMAAAKVASSSGDMRTCLKFCCRAIEVCKARMETAREEGKEGQEACEVSVEDVRIAVSEINQQAHLLAVRDAAPQEKLMLVAISNEVHISGRDLVEMDVVRERMEAICRAHPNGPRMPSVATMLEMLSRLGDGQVLSLDLSRRAPLPDVQLNMTVRDVVDMLRNDTSFSRKVLPEALLSEYPPSGEGREC